MTIHLPLRVLCIAVAKHLVKGSLGDGDITHITLKSCGRQPKPHLSGKLPQMKEMLKSDAVWSTSPFALIQANTIQTLTYSKHGLGYCSRSPIWTTKIIIKRWKRDWEYSRTLTLEDLRDNGWYLVILQYTRVPQLVARGPNLVRGWFYLIPQVFWAKINKYI